MVTYQHSWESWGTRGSESEALISGREAREPGCRDGGNGVKANLVEEGIR